MREELLKKNLLLTMLLMLATMTFAACSGKTNTDDAQTDTFKTKSGLRPTRSRQRVERKSPSPPSNTAVSASPLKAERLKWILSAS